MERLTYDFTIGGNHCWQVKGADNLECREVCERQGDDGCKTCPIAKAFDRLAAYEDTGLEPERVSDFDRLVQLFYSAGLDEKFVLACIELTNVGMAIDRLRELAQAEREGRVVVLPCKVGETIYRIEYIESDGFKIGIGEHKFDYLFFALERKNFGKTVFLTREAAEEALKAKERE